MVKPSPAPPASSTPVVVNVNVGEALIRQFAMATAHYKQNVKQKKRKNRSPSILRKRQRTVSSTDQDENFVPPFDEKPAKGKYESTIDSHDDYDADADGGDDGTDVSM